MLPVMLTIALFQHQEAIDPPPVRQSPSRGHASNGWFAVAENPREHKTKHPRVPGPLSHGSTDGEAESLQAIGSQRALMLWHAD